MTLTRRTLLGAAAVAGGGTLVPGAAQAAPRRAVRPPMLRPGDRVRAGQPLLALEAMKLETVLTAPRDATIADILVSPGAQVAPGSPLVVLT